MYCRVATPKSIEFKFKLGFKQYDITLTKEQSVLKSVMDAFEGENMQTQYSVSIQCLLKLEFKSNNSIKTKC